MNHARIMGDRQLESRLRLEKEESLNTHVSREDQDATLQHIWTYGERQIAWATGESTSHPGIDSRCITAVQWENRKSSRISFPAEKSVLFINSPEGFRQVNSGKKLRPLSTVSIAKPGIMPVRPATASELSRIKKALSVGGSEIRILTATRRSRPRIYVTEPDDTDETGNDVIDDVYCDIRKLFQSEEEEHHANDPEHNIFTERKTSVIFPENGDHHHKFGCKSKIKETQVFDINCNVSGGDRFIRKVCGKKQQDLISNIEKNVLNSDTGDECGGNIYEGSFHGDRLHSSMSSPRFDNIQRLEEKVRQKRNQLNHRYKHSVDFKRPETAPDTLMYNQKQTNTLQTNSPRQKPKSALKKSPVTRSLLTRSAARRKYSIFVKPEGPPLLEIHKKEVAMADYDGKVKEFSKKLIPFKATGHTITDYYVSRSLEEQSGWDQKNACALRFISKSPEIEAARIAKLSRIPSLTFRNVRFDYDSSSSSFQSLY